MREIKEHMVMMSEWQNGDELDLTPHLGGYLVPEVCYRERKGLFWRYLRRIAIKYKFRWLWRFSCIKTEPHKELLAYFERNFK